MKTFYKLSLVFTISAICTGCSLTDPDDRQDCARMEGVMTTNAIIAVKDLDMNNVAYVNAINDKKCPFKNMLCDNNLCVYDCNKNGTIGNFNYLDKGCFLFECVDGYWQKTDMPCHDVEICTDEKPEYTNSQDLKCVVTTCVNGKKETDKSCQFPCKKNDDNKYYACGECFDDDKKCENGVAYKCINSEWKQDETCSFGCFEDHCAQCENDQLRCSEKNVQKCINSEWSTLQSCEFNCKDNQCTECESGSLKCENNALWSCVEDSWSKQEDCPLGCEEDTPACIVPDPPKNGENCDVNEFKTVCSNDIEFLFCNDEGIIETGECQLGTECADFTQGHQCVHDARTSKEYCKDITGDVMFTNACDGTKYYYVSCEQDISGKIVAVPHNVDNYCSTRWGQFYKWSCDGSNPISEKCQSCSMSDGEAKCTKASPDVHKFNAPCQIKGARACDGDILIECDGTKYGAVYFNTPDAPLTCSEISNGELSCAQITATNHAGCAYTCEADNVTKIYGSFQQCNRGKLEIFICDLADDGEYMAISGYYTPGYCVNNEYITCDANGESTTQSCSSCELENRASLEGYVCK